MSNNFKLRHEEDFWNNYLEGYNNLLYLPYDYDWENRCEYAFFCDKINVLCESRKDMVTYVYLAWAIVLGKYSNCCDVIILTEFKGQKYPLRIILSEDTAIVSLFSEISVNVDNCIKHLSKISNDFIDDMKVNFQHSLIFISFEKIQNFVTGNFNVTFDILDGFLSYTITYNKKAFDYCTIERVSKHFEKVLREAGCQGNKRIRDISILNENEYNRVICEFSGIDREYNSELTIDGLFEKNIKQYMNSIAVVCNGRSITYKELNEQCGVVAGYLVKYCGVKQGDVVGIIMERDIEIIVAIFAILKIGAAYLPIDTQLPDSRIDYMVKSANAKIIIVDAEEKWERNVFWNLVEFKKISLSKDNYVKNSIIHGPNDLAYILFTSGSTGYPKGVAVEHKNVIGYINAFLHEFKLNQKDVMLQQSSVSFDISVEEIFPILMVGGRLVIAKQNRTDDVKMLVEIIKTNEVTILSGFPLLVQALNEYEMPNTLKTIISGGDVLRPEYITHLLNQVMVYNTYGPSETTVCVSYYKCNKIKGKNISIGKPIVNYRVYILDEKLCPVPVGIPGIICISGVGVSRGYINNSKITEEKFVDNPFDSRYKMFISGDVGKWDKEGNVIFLGRMDNQVMIRGKRTELGEVTNTILRHPDISDAYVLAVKDNAENLYLIAYIVTKKKVTHDHLIHFLKEQLPAFMIPEVFIKISELPINLNGKVDKEKLPIILS